MIQVVLVRPLYARNIGAVSRAMANMGLTQLVIINRQCEVDYDAQQAAARGQQALQDRQEFLSWEEYNQQYPQLVRMAFTARDGKARIVESLPDVLSELNKNISDYPGFAFVFGPEDWGLSNEDIGFCHRAVSIPTFGQNCSLNLAQAVLLAIYSARLTWGGDQFVYQKRTEDSQFTEGQSDWFPDQSLKKFLQAMQFDLEDRKVSAYSTIKALLLRSLPTPKEKRTLENIFEQAARKVLQNKSSQ